MSNPVKPTSRAGLGIVNPGERFWTTEVFETEDEAESYFRNLWNGVSSGPDWRDYRLVPARVTIEELSE